jgi:hypothetical protein
MTLANMRRNGVHAVIATGQACGHKADVNVDVDVLPETIAVPKIGAPGCGANVVGRAIRGLEVGTGHAASTAFQISEAVLFLTRSLPSLN